MVSVAAGAAHAPAYLATPIFSNIVASHALLFALCLVDSVHSREEGISTCRLRVPAQLRERPRWFRRHLCGHCQSLSDALCQGIPSLSRVVAVACVVGMAGVVKWVPKWATALDVILAQLLDGPL